MNLRVVRGACPHDCPDTCSFLVSVDESGRAVKIRGDPDHPTTQGFLCHKVNRYLDRTYSSDRVLHPMVRVGRKGEGRFERVSWDVALAKIAEKIRTQAAHPESILPYSYGGTLGLVQNGSMDHRFFHKLGASLLDRTICASAGVFAMDATIGARLGTDIEEVANAKLIVIWGSNTLTSNVHLWPFVEAARKQGARLVVIDPIRTKTAQRADLHLALRPGTDAALALGMMHVIFRDGLEDRAYLRLYTDGHEALEQRAQEWTVERAAAITGLEPGVIETFARAYATTQPAFIRLNYGLQRHYGGGAAVRAIVSLPAVVGAFRHAAGGALLSTSSAYPVNKHGLARPDLLQGREPRTINMTCLGDALDPSRTDPPVNLLFVYASNPAAIAPDQEKVLTGLSREDLFTVVHEIFLTDTARYADVLLPATTQLEQLDIHKSYGHLYVLLNTPAVAPIGEAVPNTEVFRRLARHLGFDDPCFQDDDETIARQAFLWDDPRMQGIDFETLRARGPRRLAVPTPYRPFAEGSFPRPNGKLSFVSEEVRVTGQDPLVGYVPPAELSDESLAREYPLALISPPRHDFMNTTFANLAFATTEVSEPSLEIHPLDAGTREIQEDDWVEITSQTGAFRARARVTEDVRPGVVSAPSIWWLTQCHGGRNANAAVSQRVTDLGGGATFYDTRVEVRRSRPG